ncbi:ion transporter [Betaproteobacteria bacterium SCGC AG-212-J23]|nr:ion transporter [Betaproteobacteria bacterium SCGC AG-212-J23]
MIVIVAVCALLVVATTAIHFEVLRGLSAGLPRLRIPSRGKLLVVIFATFLAHAVEILLYALAVYLLGNFSFNVSLYFSAETYTSLGYGDVVPTGDLRLVAGVEALNGLLLIGWSASYTFIAMERFWQAESK